MCTGRVDLSFVLRAFANGTDGVLIAGCWLGECHYSQKKFDQAIAEFEAVANNYPGSQKVPSSLLKMGYSYLEMGNVSKGKIILGELVDKYPKTREAFLAKSRLANLK